ncbi:hypothetical protein FRC10_001916, partial [Ceratobasidium sp. 414]
MSRTGRLATGPLKNERNEPPSIPPNRIDAVKIAPLSAPRHHHGTWGSRSAAADVPGAEWGVDAEPAVGDAKASVRSETGERAPPECDHAGMVGPGSERMAEHDQLRGYAAEKDPCRSSTRGTSLCLPAGAFISTASMASTRPLRPTGRGCILLMRTRLKSQGAAQVVKALAANVHEHGGTVVYVDREWLAPSIWGQHIDLHLEMDIEQWARECVAGLGTVSTDLAARSLARRTSVVKLIIGSKEIKEGKQTANDGTSALPAKVEMLLDEVCRGASVDRNPTERPMAAERPKKRVRFTPELSHAPTHLPQPLREPLAPTLFV